MFFSITRSLKTNASYIRQALHTMFSNRGKSSSQSGRSERLSSIRRYSLAFSDSKLICKLTQSGQSKVCFLPVRSAAARTLFAKGNVSMDTGNADESIPKKLLMQFIVLDVFLIKDCMLIMSSCRR